MQPPPPDLPPRGHQTTARNAGGRAPNQDISVPNRSQPLQDMFNPPSIPPRPGAQTRENTYSSTQAPQAPPPPPPPPPPQPYNPDSNRIQAPPAPPPPPPVNNYTSGGGAPPPPPPPPLPADFGNAPPPPPPPPSANSGSTRPAVPASTGSRDDLLSQIRGFSTTKLKVQKKTIRLFLENSSCFLSLIRHKLNGQHCRKFNRPANQVPECKTQWQRTFLKFFRNVERKLVRFLFIFESNYKSFFRLSWTR